MFFLMQTIYPWNIDSELLSYSTSLENAMTGRENHVQKEYGFTLIELLVVITIIALLLAILLPSLRHAHESGNMTVCSSQLDQIFNGMFVHSLNNDEHLPYMGGPHMSGNGEWWITQVTQAMEQFVPEMYKCPSDSEPDKSQAFYFNRSLLSMNPIPHTATAKTITIRIPVTYRSSCDLLEEDVVTGGWRPRKITSWRYPAKALAIVEGGRGSTASCFRMLDELVYLDDPRVSTRADKSWKRHLGQANYLFLDGHVDTLMPREVAELSKTQEYYLP